MASGLIGPPSLRRDPTKPLPSTTPDQFISLLDAGFGANPQRASAESESDEPLMGLTENGSATFLSSGNPCVDFFFQVVPSTPSFTVFTLLSSAWDHDPLTALKLLCHLRGVRGTGKSDKEGFYAGAMWLHRNHPKTLALNVASFAEFGYMKDLLEILFRVVHGDNIREEMKKEREEMMKERAEMMKEREEPPSSKKPVPRSKKRAHRRRGVRILKLKCACLPDLPKKTTLADFIAAMMASAQSKNSSVTSEAVVADSEEEPKEETVEKKTSKPKNSMKPNKAAYFAGNAILLYSSDTKYRFLYDQVAEFFAAMLASDLEKLNSGNHNKIGLAAKWCPSLDKSFDRSTLLCEAIARRMFPRNSNPEYESIAEEHYAYQIRNRLRREVLVPIRKVLELPEVYMSAQRWGELPYSRVASVAMKRYSKHFMKHDEKRFEEYLEKVKTGEAKIAAGALLPHEIAASAYQGEDDQVAELQWKRMVNDLLEKGTLSNCIAVCDVSGSMSGTPMEVCVALGILVSELSEEPWKGKVITFHESPSIQTICGSSLKEKMKFVQSMDWGGSTNFQGVFDRILSLAVEAGIKPECMVKKVFVFSDMEFNEARGDRDVRYHWGTAQKINSWETDYEVICKKFMDNGFGDVIPEIVFWNLRDSKSIPVTANQKGVALVSGFSKNLLKVFLEGKPAPTPVEVMMEAISGPEYQKLVVFD